MIQFIIFLIFFVFSLKANMPSTSYNWPCIPFDQQHWINGTFCENRAGNSGPIDHFHDGVDIHLSQDGQVYSVINGTVTSIGWPDQYGINSWVRVGRYAYVHVIPAPGLSVGDPVTAFEIVLGTTNEWNHIHFKDGYPGSEINALLEGSGLSPFVDTYNPEVINTKFYIDGTTTEFSNNKVYGLIDIVSQAADVTDTGPIGGNNGVYKMGFDIVNENSEIVVGPRIPYQFDEIPSSNSYVHNVFHQGSNTSTYRYIISNHITNNGKVDVSNWAPGFYQARVFTWDTRNNVDTLVTQFEVTEQDTIAPESPTLLSVTHEGEGFRIRWLPNQEEDLVGYRLYFSYNLETWTNNHNESILTDTVTQLVVPSFSKNITIYFKLTAVDDAPFTNESKPSDIYGLRLSDNLPNILIVDAFDRTDGIWTDNSHPFAAFIGERFGNINQQFDTINDDLFLLDSTFSITDYSAVILYTLDDLDPLPVPLIEQLNTQGDGLWLIGSRLLQSLSSDSLGNILLNLHGLAEGPIYSTPESLNGDGIFDIYTFQLNAEWYSLDSLTSVIATESMLSSSLTDEAGIWFGAQSYHLLYTATPLEVLFGSESHDDLMEEIVHHLTSTFSVDPESLIPEKFNMTVYPNPFNSVVTLRFAIPTTGILKISLFSILGQQIWHEDVSVFAGSAISKSLPKELLKNLSSGIYLIRADLRSNNETLLKSKSQKIVFIK